MKKIVIIVVVLLLASAGAAGYFMFGGLKEGDFAEEKPVVIDTPEYVRLKPLGANVINGNRIIGRLTLELTLEVFDEDARVHVRYIMEHLCDTHMTVLHTMLDYEMSSGPKVDLDHIKSSLLTASQQLFGDDVILAVLVQTIERRGQTLAEALAAAPKP